MKKIRWGLVSTANINRRVIPAIQESPRGQLAAVASRTLESAQEYAEYWEIPKTFGSYQEMLDSDDVDAVYISLPNHLHAEWSIKAMRSGKHVLCEKPFALTLADVDRMTAVAAETGMVLSEAFMYRHHPQTKMVGEFVKSGMLGEVTLVRGTFNFTVAKPENIRLASDMGGGSLWDVGVYPMSFAQYIMGERPEWVVGDQKLGPSGVDIFFSGQMHYSGGRMAQISSAFNTPLYTMAEVIGTKGRLRLTRPFTGVHEDSNRITFYPNDLPPEELTLPEEYLYLGEVEDMQAAILDGADSFLTLAETRDHVRTVLALYESAQKKQFITL